MFGHGSYSKEWKQVQQFLFSTSDKCAHTGNLIPADIYNNREISILISFTDHPQIDSLMLYMMAKYHLWPASFQAFTQPAHTDQTLSLCVALEK